jgi:quinol monooxygenase YgiN
MVTVFLTHEVKDFTKWKELFDLGEDLRSQAGVKTTGVFTSVDNPNQVTVTTEFPSAEAVEGFLNHPQLKETMEKAGVTSKPEIKILNKA